MHNHRGQTPGGLTPFRFTFLLWLFAATWPAAAESLSDRELAAIGQAMTLTLRNESCEKAEDEPRKRLKEFFGDLPTPSKDSQTTAIPLDADGHLLSLAIEPQCERYDAILPDGTRADATLIAYDPGTTLAVLKAPIAIDPPRFGSTDELLPGDSVMSVGSPFGLTGTLSRGLVTTTHRYLPGYDDSHYLQTDAVINPGHAGGPLLDSAGRVVGLHSMIFTRSRDFDGLAFALPINVALRVAEDLLKHGSVRRGRIGINVAEADGRAGALVAQVEEIGPSHTLLHTGDLIVTIGEHRVPSPHAARVLVGLHRPGEVVTFNVIRDERSLRVEVTAGE